MGEYLIEDSRKVSVTINCYNAKTMSVVITNDAGNVIEAQEFTREDGVTGYVIETVLSKKTGYNITVTADKGTANERSITDRLYVSGTGKYIAPDDTTSSEQETLGEMIEEDSYLMVKQVFLGDYTTESTAAGAAARVVVGFIPVVGVAADIRDLTAQAVGVNSATGEITWKPSVGGMAVAGIASLPAGDAVKLGGKTIAKNSDEWLKLAKSTEKVLENSKEAKLVVKRGNKIIKQALNGESFDDLFHLIKNGDEMLGIEATKDGVKQGISFATKNADEVADVVESGSNTIGIGELVVRDTKFLDSDGNIDWEKWAPNGGRVAGTIKENQTIPVGTIIDRYGSQWGKYASPAGVPFEQRALPYIENPNAYHKYEVLKPIDNVTTSEIAPAFEQVGGGMQYELPDSIKKLEDLGYVREVK